jgi:tetratricopeptide (TPR) repeat protein
MQRLDEAERTAREALEHLPLVPRLWFDLAIVARNKGDRAGEIGALKQALEITPGWTHAAQELADAYMRAGTLDEARALLADAITRTPQNPYLRGYLADVLWRAGDHAAALEEVKTALLIEPDYDWGWHSLRNGRTN